MPRLNSGCLVPARLWVCVHLCSEGEMKPTQRCWLGRWQGCPLLVQEEAPGQAQEAPVVLCGLLHFPVRGLLLERGLLHRLPPALRLRAAHGFPLCAPCPGAGPLRASLCPVLWWSETGRSALMWAPPPSLPGWCLPDATEDQKLLLKFHCFPQTNVLIRWSPMNMKTHFHEIS